MVAGASGISFIKTDSIGTVLWTRLLGRTGAGCITAQHTSDGGYIIIGYIRGNPYAVVYLLKTDATGMPTWSKTFGGEYDRFANSGQQTSDGGYIITGFNNNNISNKTFLIKTDANGDVN